MLVTGADGFVGRRLCRFLAESGDEVLALEGPSEGTHDGATTIDVRDPAKVSRALAQLQPDRVVHLAAISSVARSHADPSETFQVNALGTLHVCIAANALKPSPRVLIVSSGEVYGPVPPRERASETSPVVPTSPYAASKVAAEVVAMQYARSYGLHVVCARPFSHLGAGQAPTFAMPSFARQLAQARRAGGSTTISVGDLAPVRDFSHVDDVIAAYRLLLEHGEHGQVYNVCSGTGRSVRSALDELIELAGVVADVKVDPSKVRPVELPSLIGDPSRLEALGWRRRHTVHEALQEIMEEAIVAGGVD